MEVSVTLKTEARIHLCYFYAKLFTNHYNLLKAVALKRYGSPLKLKIEEFPKPKPKPHQALIKIKSTAVNDYDWGMVRGLPYMYRLLFGLFGPRHPIPGMELAGIVEATGEEVENLQVGDAVYGDTSQYGFGTFAEYIAIDARALYQKPRQMTFERAAAIPHAALLAYQSMQKADLKPGMSALINGAGGGVGTLALQMLKPLQIRVTGVDHESKMDFMRNAGFDEVMDYQKTDFTRTGKKYDFILDAKTTRGPSAYKRVLNEQGVYVTVGGALPRLLQHFLLKPFYSKKGGQQLHILALDPNKGLDEISTLFVEGKLDPLIDGPYQLEDVPRLIQYFGEGKHQGKVVVNLD